LKISGNVMASQKLHFLQELDRGAISDASAPAPTASAAAASQSPAPAAAARADEMMGALAGRLEKDAAFAADLNARVLVRVTEPDAVWTIDLRDGARAVAQGEQGEANAVLTLADEALTALTTGESTLAEAFQRGDVRVDGDMDVARRCDFLEGIL
jgi:3-hydroxyacyl-CoA dehydrogenase/3a,7a,12a-trihydroxy-5b-cholest-24-enoyl-CoA hydratase